MVEVGEDDFHLCAAESSNHAGFVSRDERFDVVFGGGLLEVVFYGACVVL